MMKKKILIILCCLMICVSFGGCGDSSQTDIGIVNCCGRDFLEIDTPGIGYITVDVETKVQYMHFSIGNTARVAVLVDSDGKPILYEGSILDE